jgi:hypothetical protein
MKKFWYIRTPDGWVYGSKLFISQKDAENEVKHLPKWESETLGYTVYELDVEERPGAWVHGKFHRETERNYEQ